MNTAPLSDSGSQLALSYYEDLWHDLPAHQLLEPEHIEAQHAGYRALALQAFAAAENQALALSGASKRTWRVTHVECLCPRAFPLGNPRRAKAGALDAATGTEQSEPTTVRLSLLARISLACTDAPFGVSPP